MATAPDTRRSRDRRTDGWIRTVPNDLTTDDEDLSVDDPTLAAGFVQLPRGVLRDAEISLAARLTYALLLDFYWEVRGCFPGRAKLSERAGCSIQSMDLYLAELKRRGWISVRQRGLGKTNKYTLHAIRKEVSESQPVRNQESQPARTPESQSAPTLESQPVRTNLEKDTNTEIIKNPPATSSLAPQGRPKRPRPVKTTFPKDFGVTVEMTAWAVSKGVMAERIPAETEAFRLYHESKGSQFVDWRKAWQTWMGNAVKFDSKRIVRPAPKPGSGKTADEWAQRARELGEPE